MKASDAKTKTMPLSDSLIEVKFIPIGDNPRNNPASPTRLKLNATDNTASSKKPNLFSFVANKMFTRQ